VHVLWVVPENGAQPITRYKIEFLANDGVTYLQVPNGAFCNGLDPSLSFCEVPMSTLTSDPFKLA
jgi:hypothetical protein